MAITNPLRPLVQKYFEGPQLLRMGGSAARAKALEIGCGSGGGINLLFETFKVREVDAFDIDFEMLKRINRKHRSRRLPVKLWVGNTREIPVADATYDVVFDFGTLHHVHDWQSALVEIHRVLKPGGRFYVEEITRQFIVHPVWRRLLDHPQENRFDRRELVDELYKAGFAVCRSRQFAGLFIWCVADKISQ
jgi:ubiquinone/menaquinone biosynthesis C-methylase UbiE